MCVQRFYYSLIQLLGLGNGNVISGFCWKCQTAYIPMYQDEIAYKMKSIKEMLTSFRCSSSQVQLQLKCFVAFRCNLYTSRHRTALLSKELLGKATINLSY